MAQTPGPSAIPAVPGGGRAGAAGYTHAVAADLGWSAVSARTAVAVCAAGGSATLAAAGRGDEAIHEALVALPARSRVLLLLDVPLAGLEQMGTSATARTRPVDRAMASAGIAALPAAMAGRRGPVLLDALVAAHGRRLARLDVRELYPYAVYRVLSYLEAYGRLDALMAPGPALALLDDTFPRFRHARYKRRQPDAARRWEAITALHGLLCHPALDLRWSGLTEPWQVRGRAEDILVDAYEAALGGVLGALALRGSPYAALAGDSSDGEMALITDVWLRERLARRVRVGPLAPGVG